jgi:hypothetical protein
LIILEGVAVVGGEMVKAAVATALSRKPGAKARALIVVVAARTNGPP